ncbi:unnamed protein product [Candidula unifasciata]|uniref:Uncharacterized protein n=1 Tax=Candidula unifasciata TaxID=100452 RepID=A0A8S3ZTS1_9EUPU|nr:unnamed protein product [Candidula unifasciata]
MVAMMPSFIVSIRCVKEEDKPFAVGFSAFAGTLIGWFPGPVIFGSLVDSTCILWRTTCGSVGACSLYDIELFRLRIHALMMGLRIITLFFFILALVFALCSKEPVFQSHMDEVTIAVTANGHKTSKKTDPGSKECTKPQNKETYI